MADDRPGLLIVEDDLGLQKQLKWCFDEYRVWVAATRAEALAQLRRFEPAVVLQDLGLPPDAAGVSEGLRTCRRSCKPRLKSRSSSSPATAIKVTPSKRSAWARRTFARSPSNRRS